MMDRCLQPASRKRGASPKAQDLQRSRVKESGAVPVKRSRMRIDKMAGHAAPLKFRREKQARGSGAHDQNRRTNEGYDQRLTLYFALGG
jgi:hypothetical protein